MPKIVQFTHPGQEHKPDKKSGNITSWNTGKHKRKFLLTKGEVVSGNDLKEVELAFWGEWEPSSNVTALASRPNKFFPQWLHRPYLPSFLPNPLTDMKDYQNTDPCVFDDRFKYFVCKQFKTKPNRCTALATLDKGSLILFGSTGYQSPNEAFFQLDTVFVVADYLEYDVADPNALISAGLRISIEIMFSKCAFPIPPISP